MYLKTAGLRSLKENRTNIGVCGPSSLNHSELNKSVEAMESNSGEKSHSKPPAKEPARRDRYGLRGSIAPQMYTIGFNNIIVVCHYDHVVY